MKGSRIIPVVLSGVQGGPVVHPALDRLIMFDESTGLPIEPESLGTSGPQGAVGPQGPVGPQGGMGGQGTQGVQGAIGVQGGIGAQGSQGAIGPSPPYDIFTGRPAGADKDLFIQTDETLPPNASGTNVGLWQKEGGAYVRVAPRLKHGDNHKYDGIDPLFPADFLDFFDLRRTSEVSTMPRILANTSLSMTSGVIYGTYAVARTAGTFTKMRFMTGTTITGCTGLKGIVANSAGVKITETADLSASALAATLYDNVALGAGVTVVKGEVLFIGYGFVGTTQNGRGITGSISQNALAPALVRSGSGWAGGAAALPNLSSVATTAVITWAELIL